MYSKHGRQMKSYILVCGGAGYIGSHMVKMLQEQNYNPLVLDDLSTGHLDSVKNVPCIQQNLLDDVGLEKFFTKYTIDAVMHFAAKSLVAESVSKPLLYYRNNVSGIMGLLEVMRKHDVYKIIFSSSAAVYGQPKSVALVEEDPTAPISPYGRSKAQAEVILKDAWSAYAMSSVSLRYFNAAGAHPDGTLGERHSPETHLIPNILRALIDDKEVHIFGDDYNTDDGTCVRDYIHVQDICRAHLLALGYLDKVPGAHTFNLGTGKGFSIKKIIEAVEQITGRTVKYTIAPRRMGDPAILTASAEKAKHVLGWVQKDSSIENILQTAWQWYCQHGGS